ncbi:hypothetical protein STRPS_1096 [Streptococcus pseudoporcinus LQ 940-04]|uniref:Uncharacterized protein n=1 Tax=Streptococcus pseudoporcinus LQ 940-04 TaxID=875093 RepID=G5K790_9STRE|nr:hypothetical protein HMPREF9320_0945 [Streptococcus pseudoporcinus SPIN 20026]EHI65586.1 hypothetical protein STRPS_1096 [Streptococcus pseudoporcinus LQ 940-04]
MRFKETRHNLIFFAYGFIILSKKRRLVMASKEQSGIRKAF